VDADKPPAEVFDGVREALGKALAEWVEEGRTGPAAADRETPATD
jgi:hypothetical protein